MIRAFVSDKCPILRKGLISILNEDPEIDVIGEADNGRATLRMAIEMAPHVLVTDVSMPELNGLEIARQLVKVYPKIKIIVFSQCTNEEYVNEAIEVGVMGYLHKTSTATEMIFAIKAAMKGEIYLSSCIVSNVLKKIYIGRGQGDEGGVNWMKQLTPREREVLQLIAEGNTNPQIADKLCVSLPTVKSHRANLMEKLSLRNTAEIVKFAIKVDLIDVA